MSMYLTLSIEWFLFRALKNEQAVSTQKKNVSELQVVDYFK